MSNRPKRQILSSYISQLAANGIYTFSLKQFVASCNLADISARKILSRGLKQKAIVSVAKGFYVVIPPEYKALGCLEASEFIPHLMAHWQEDYYVCLLSAASFHGAAHHAPMSFQVMTTKAHRPISAGKVSVHFYKSKYVNLMPTLKKNTRRSIVRVSTPETTAFDLVARSREAGGFGNVVTVLNDLGESIQNRHLLQAAKKVSEVAYLQRLGYILDSLGFADKTSGLLNELNRRTYNYTPLVPYISDKNDANKNPKWKIIENEEIEPEI